MDKIMKWVYHIRQNAPCSVPISIPLLLYFPSVSLTFSPLGFRSFHSDISHPEFFIAHSTRTSHIQNSSSPILSGCLTSGILPRRHSTQTSHIQTSSSPIPPGHLTSRILHRHSIRMSHIRNSSPPPLHSDISHPPLCPANIPPSPDVSQPPFYPTNILPYPDVSHPDLKVNFFPPRGLKHVHLCMAAFPKSNCVNVFSDSGYFKIIWNHQNFVSFILSIFL